MVYRKKRTKPKAQPYSPLQRLVLPSVLVMVLLGFILLVQSILTPEPHVLPLLQIPVEKTFTYSGELQSPQKTTSVLGAETIDPRDIITYVNEERMKRGIRPLRVSEPLMKAAKMRADVMLRHENFSHQDPYEGIQLDTVLPKLKYPFIWASENIGMGDTNGRDFVTGFMNSPSHRDNLLNPALVETGVAIVTGKYKQWYVNMAVQLFAIPTDHETYAGYTKKDLDEYKLLLTDIGKQIDATKVLQKKNPQDYAYYENWKTLLIRQQEIIATLSYAMEANQPLAKDMISLMKEYNANWATVPVKEQ